MILEATVQKLWMFEVFGQGLARAGMYWSQPARIDHLHKKWRARKKNSKKNGQIGCRPAAGRPGPTASRHQSSDQGSPTVGCQLVSGWQPAIARQPQVDTCTGPVYSIYFNFFKLFLKLASTLGSVKSCIFYGDWRFHFF
jgi:hypothetical protein